MIWYAIGAWVQIFQYLIVSEYSEKIVKFAALLLLCVAFILIVFNIWPSSKVSYLLIGYLNFGAILKKQVKK